MNALTFANQVLQLLPMVVRGVSGAAEAMQWGRERVSAMAAEERDPVENEWSKLNERTAELRAQLHTD